MLAEQIDEAAAVRGLHVPTDLSLSVMGDVIGASTSTRDWSGYSVAGHEMGSAALNLLNQILDSSTPEPRHLLVPCTPEQGVTVTGVPIEATR